MKGFVNVMKITLEIITDAVKAIGYYVRSNLRNFATFLIILLPYAMYIIGQYVMLERGKFAIGSELLIPLIACIIIFWLKSYANKINKGIKIPVPKKRFTHVDSDGEITIHNDRIQELLLYLADLEDWLERKGLM